MERHNTNTQMKNPWFATRVAAIALAALVVLSGPAALAQDTASTPASVPASQPAEKDKTGAGAKLVDRVAKSFVIVRYTYRKDLTDPAAEEAAGDIYSEYIDMKRPAETTGVVLDDAGHILVRDDGVEQRFIESIEVETADGKMLSAQRTRRLRKAIACILEVKPEQAKLLTPPKTAVFESKGVRTALVTTSMGQVDGEWCIRTGSLSTIARFGAAKDGEPKFLLMGETWLTEPTIAGNAKGEPVGIITALPADHGQSRVVWQWADLLKADGEDLLATAKRQEAIRKTMGPSILKIVIRSRGEETDGWWDDDGGGAGREEIQYGLAFSDREILVPTPLTQTKAAKITDFQLELPDKTRQELTFVGALKTLSAYVLELPEGKLPGVVPLRDKPIGPLVPLWTGTMMEKYGKTYLDLRSERMWDRERGYRGKWHWVISPASGRWNWRSMNVGTLVLDETGRLSGIQLIELPENGEKAGQGLYEREMWGFVDDNPFEDMDDMARVIHASELQDVLKNAKEKLDPRIKVSPRRTEVTRRAWFGAGTNEISLELAKAWKIQTQTKDGSIGAIVGLVFPDSPAAKAGIVVGDVLLTIQVPDRDYPIELRGQSIDGTMDEIGVGKTVQVARLHKGKDGAYAADTIEYKIEMGPPTAESAEKWKNRKIGLTCQDLTYEVRYHGKLDADEPGVVITGTESGSPAQLARLEEGQIIQKVDGKPVTTARQLRDLIAEAHDAGKAKVRLSLWILGRTWFADLDVTSYDPADDQALSGKDDGKDIPEDVEIDVDELE